MKHPKPEVWAGSVGAELEAHAASCAECRKVRARVVAARTAMADLGKSPAPELNWDTLGARLGWTISSELKAKEREREREGRRGWTFGRLPLAFASLALVAAALTLYWYVSRPSTPPLRGSAQDDRAVVTPSPSPVAPAAPSQLEGVVTFLQGDVTIGGQPAALDTPVAAGARIATKHGRIAVQFGDRTGFMVEEDSTLEVARFDGADVELAVSGAVDVEVSHRKPDQRFAVHAGERTVEVRGTIFRVGLRDEALDVRVSRGRVAVLEGTDAVEVPAGAMFLVPKGGRIAAYLPQALAAAEAMHVPMVPGWTTAAELRDTSVTLDVAAGAKVPVRIDGEDTGLGPLLMRTDAGRHLIEVGATSRWVELESGGYAATRLPETNPRSERPGQVEERLLARAKMFKNLAKRLDHPVTVVFVIEVNADGSIGSIQFDDPRDEALNEAITQILESFDFPPGSHSMVKKSVTLSPEL